MCVQGERAADEADRRAITEGFVGTAIEVEPSGTSMTVWC